MLRLQTNRWRSANAGAPCSPDFLDALFGGGFATVYVGNGVSGWAPTEGLAELPHRWRAAIRRRWRVQGRGRRRAMSWYHDYLDALVQRDVIGIWPASAALEVLAATARVSRRPGRRLRLFNVSDLAAPFQLSRPTIRRDYVALLERVFLLERGCRPGTRID